MASVDLFRAQLSAWGIGGCSREMASFVAFAEMLAGYERANVIGTKDFDRVLLDHVLDSLACLLFAPARDAHDVADVGSGGGLPGVPLSVALPGARVALFESTGKKADFLRSAVRELQTEKTTVVQTRVEDAGREDRYRACFDLCTARAVAQLSVVAEYCVPLARIGGHVIAMKGDPDRAEIEAGREAAELLGARVEEIIKVPILPEIGAKERRLIVLEKVRSTPDRYPRKPGTPAKRPLGSG